MIQDPAAAFKWVNRLTIVSKQAPKYSSTRPPAPPLENRVNLRGGAGWPSIPDSAFRAGGWWFARIRNSTCHRHKWPPAA